MGGLERRVKGVPLPVKYETPWDADKITGCVCEISSNSIFTASHEDFKEYDCSNRACPAGHHHETCRSELKHTEQVITCKTSSPSRAKLRFTFRGDTTSILEGTATHLEVEKALEALKTIDDVRVSFTNSSAR